MRARHVTSDAAYRVPFGAVRVGSAVTLGIDVWDEPDASVQLRLWVDEKGEILLDMAAAPEEDHVHFSVTFEPEEPEIIWYSFRITASDGAVMRYGARGDVSCGEGDLFFGDPASFQITVYDRGREVLPDWYKNGVVYQIFPDRFARGRSWEKLSGDDLARSYNGPKRRLVKDWDASPSYERDGDGAIVAWDFYGGNLEGIREKLGYLEGLGITVIYLNPIFAAASNHRYDTVDYMRIDGMLGTERDFSRLCADAKAHGISIILDGVFNHVGADSLYFNRAGFFPDLGAAQGEGSLYRSWFTFHEDGSYDSWWGNPDLPAVREDCPEFRELICGRDGVVRKWLRLGARGWRLDVADELSDGFIEDIKAAALAEREDAVVIGEVWEDASNKRAYGRLRRYFLGLELDGTMNYPLRHAIISFLRGEGTAHTLADTLESLYENYPRENFMSELNLLGSHDRMRLLTLLGGAPLPDGLSDDQRRTYRLDEGAHGLAVSRLWVAAFLQMCLPGVPCVYYGDEAGLEGYADPYCRAPFPWGRENADCFNVYRNAIALRKALPVLVDGDFEPFAPNDDVFCFWRRDESDEVCVLANGSRSESHTIRIPTGELEVTDVISGRVVTVRDGVAEVFLWPLGTSVIALHQERRLQRPMRRGMGVLCHVTSLPNEDQPSLPGTLGEPARRFVDRLAEGHMRYWQVLPVNPTDGFGSPYAGPSAFAGNVSLMWGVSPDGTTSLPSDLEHSVPYRRFVEGNESWLLPYATFMAIKKVEKGRPWQEWPNKFRTWKPALASDRRLAGAVEHECALQFFFMRQWLQIRAYANRRGIQIIGDVPMYVSTDSSDVWANPELFELDAKGYPAVLAGTPPDAFAQEGQVWGNPTYNWSLMRADGYSWWLRRLERAFELYDYVRLDHFLGFSSYYAIPKGQSARAGQWNFACGLDLFRTAYRKFGPLPVVAEDLGSVTPAVRALLEQTGFPGMDVIQFADEDVRAGYHPAPDKVVYSSTHDTNTLLGWVEEHFGFDKGDPEGMRQACELAERLVGECLTSPADVVILPLQDLLMLGASARMNVPGVATGNWGWQARPDALVDASHVMSELAKSNDRA